MKKRIGIILGLTLLFAGMVFLAENVFTDWEPIVTRNTYGEGKKTETYELTVEGEETVPFQLEIQEREYGREEMQQLFEEVIKQLDRVTLGENESFDYVDQDLNLVTKLEDYPVTVQWELSSYDVMNIVGEIQTEDVPKEGTLLEIRGIISYGKESTVYVRNVSIYPPTREGMDKVLYEIRKTVMAKEENTRQEENFRLPKEIDGKQLVWSKAKEQHWYYVLLIGVVCVIFPIYKEKERKRKEEEQRKDALLRAYPGMLSKITMLLGTGTTVKNAWEKIVQNYEKQHSHTEIVYEEMKTTLYEMQGGVPEAEAYERFGKRCNTTAYIKFGALLSQNLRKGSKGLSELLRMEAIQSFENRKSRARQKGEEAGTKLLMPMMGMLAVVLIMVMIPAFLTMQL